MILAIDSSSKAASCALLDGDKVLAESFCNVGVISDVTLFAATSGPGSFTGVRIGASILLGLSFGKDLPCVGVSTLEVTAYPFSGYSGAIICPVMDARRNQFYNALFRDGQRLTEDRAISAEELDAELERLGAPVLLCGDGYALAAKLLSGRKYIDPPDDLIYPRASNAARLAAHFYASAPDKSIFRDLDFKPVYLRSSQAERVMNEKKRIK